MKVHRFEPSRTSVGCDLCERALSHPVHATVSNKHKGDVMFDEVEEDEREIRRLQRGQLFRRPKPKLPEQQQGDVMERRDRTVINDFSRLLDKVMYADGTQARIDARLQAAREHATLVEQRDLLVAAVSQVQNEAESTHPDNLFAAWVVRECRAVLATVEQGGEA